MGTRAGQWLKRDVEGIVRMLLPFTSVALLAMGLYAAANDASLKVFGVSLVVAVASTGVGAVLGFIFGIPRVLRGADVSAPLPTDPTKPTPVTPEPKPKGYVGNSNLEEISDWLAKLLVGAGLAQLGGIADKLVEVAKFVGGELGSAAGTTFALGLMLSFAILGFFLSYLFARRVLPVVFLRADTDGGGLSDDTKQDVDAALQMLSGGEDPELVRRAFSHRLSELAQLPQDAVAPEDRATWAKARLIEGDYNVASRELASASARAPKDESLSELSVFSALYADAPDGFRHAIELGEAMKPSPLLHAWLASAWGQKHGWDQKHGVAEAELKNARDKAVQHAKAALAGDPGLKALLAPLRDPPVGSEDRDLESLKDDEELKTLLA